MGSYQTGNFENPISHVLNFLGWIKLIFETPDLFKFCHCINELQVIQVQKQSFVYAQIPKICRDKQFEFSRGFDLTELVLTNSCVMGVVLF